MHSGKRVETCLARPGKSVGAFVATNVITADDASYILKRQKIIERHS